MPSGIPEEVLEEVSAASFPAFLYCKFLYSYFITAKLSQRWVVGVEAVVSELEDLLNGSGKGLLHLEDVLLLTTYATLIAADNLKSPYRPSKAFVYSQEQLQRLRIALLQAYSQVKWSSPHS